MKILHILIIAFISTVICAGCKSKEQKIKDTLTKQAQIDRDSAYLNRNYFLGVWTPDRDEKLWDRGCITITKDSGGLLYFSFPFVPRSSGQFFDGVQTFINGGIPDSREFGITQKTKFNDNADTIIGFSAIVFLHSKNEDFGDVKIGMNNNYAHNKSKIDTTMLWLGFQPYNHLLKHNAGNYKYVNYYKCNSCPAIMNALADYNNAKSKENTPANNYSTVQAAKKVANAYLVAKDLTNYNKWRAIVIDEGKAAGDGENAAYDLPLISSINN